MYGIQIESETQGKHIVSHAYTVVGAAKLLKSERRLFKILPVKPVLLRSLNERINSKAEWLKLHNTTCA